VLLWQHDTWVLDTPQYLTVASGDPAIWADSSLDYVEISKDGSTAYVRLHTHNGLTERKLNLQDSSDGAAHFVNQDAASQRTTKLSFNPQTHEYFFEESGAGNGTPYKVSSHAWLTQGTAGGKAK
jgi:hypothetical protein